FRWHARVVNNSTFTAPHAGAARSWCALRRSPMPAPRFTRKTTPVNPYTRTADDTSIAFARRDMPAPCDVGAGRHVTSGIPDDIGDKIQVLAAQGVVADVSGKARKTR